MALSDPRMPSFMGKSASGDGATPVAFRNLRDVPPPPSGFARRIDAPAAAERPATAAHFAPLHPPPPQASPPVAPPAPVIVKPPAEPDYPAIGRAVATLKLHGERLAADARSDALEIGFQVARRILEMELSSNPEALFSLIRTALARAGEARTVKVRLNPDDVLRVESSGGPAQLTNFSLVAVQLVADPTLSRGDCVVDTDMGSVDGRLNTRLEELHRGLKSALEEEAA